MRIQKYLQFFALLSLPLLTFGCGGSKDPEGGTIDGGLAGGAPCTESIMCASGLCLANNTCANDCFSQSCPTGNYCSAEGICTADCSPDKDECGEGSTCSIAGQCVSVSDGGGGDADCPDVSVNLTPEVPTVVLVIDRSGSMFDNDFGDFDTRWEAVESTLTDATTGVVKTLQSKVRFGAMFYTSNNGNASPPCPRLHTVSPAISNLSGVTKLYDDHGNRGDETPTGEAIAAAVADFPQEDGPRILIIATDGEPDSCAIANPSNQTQQDSVNAEVEAQVDAAFKKGIQSFILSVGEDTSLAHLTRMARLGQGDAPGDNTSKAVPYVADSPAKLVDAFDTIFLGIRSCDLALDGEVDGDQASQGVVTLNGSPLAFNTDWKLKDKSTIELLGASCNDFLTEETVSLSASFPCGSVTLK
ncbi:MAG: VWA domain-containing protein [Myxococcales bacterium]|nr:VWA domain-containing protein [Myxococcales bacterium]